MAKVDLDEFEMPRPVSIIKLDVENAEGLALPRARELLQTDRPRVLAEINPKQLLQVSGSSAADWIAEMAGFGFECRLLDGGQPGERIESTDSQVNVAFLPRRE